VPRRADDQNVNREFDKANRAVTRAAAAIEAAVEALLKATRPLDAVAQSYVIERLVVELLRRNPKAVGFLNTANRRRRRSHDARRQRANGLARSVGIAMTETDEILRDLEQRTQRNEDRKRQDIATEAAARKLKVDCDNCGKPGAPYVGFDCGLGVYFCDDCTAEMLALEVEIP
jgi:hypothetical protein